MALVIGQRRPHHQAQEHASAGQWHIQRYWMGAATCTEGVRYDGIIEERDGEGGDSDPTRHHQGGEQEEMTGPGAVVFYMSILSRVLRAFFNFTVHLHAGGICIIIILEKDVFL